MYLKRFLISGGVMNHKEVNEYRNSMREDMVGIKVSLKYLVESQNRQTAHLESINGRVRTNEKAISAIKGVGSTVAIIFTSLIGFLFKKG